MLIAINSLLLEKAKEIATLSHRHYQEQTLSFSD